MPSQTASAEISMEAIAERLGVSVTTVSRALNCRNKGIRKAASKRAEKIRALARELGYRPSAAPRAMVTKRYNAVALLRPMDYRRGHLPMHRLRGLEEALGDASLQLVLTRIADDRLSDDAYVQTFLSRWFVDGILMDYETGYPQQLAELLERYHLPTVWLNVKHAFDCVRPDDFGGAKLATEHLLKLGHRRIAIWVLPSRPGTWEPHYSSGERQAGYSQAMREAGLEPIVYNQWMEYIDRIPFVVSKIRQPEAPTAWVTLGPTEAMAVLGAANEIGLRIPHDLSHVTFHNDWTYADAMRVTSVEIPEYEVGRQAIAMLIRKIESPHVQLAPAVIPMKLCERYSCRAIAG